MLTSLLWFSCPFASHKSGKNISWMAQGQKYVQGCVKAAFLIGTFPEQKLWSAAVCTRGKKEQNGKGAKLGSVRSPVLGHFEDVHGSLTRFVHIGPSLRKLVHGCAHPRRSPFQPLTPLSPILSNLDREFSFAFSAQRWYWLPCHCPWRDWICAGLNRIEQLKIWIHQSPEELNPPIWNWKLQNPNSNVERSAIGQWMNFVPKKRKTGAC